MSEFPALIDANVRSPTYYVARTSVRCRRCGSPTGLLALAVPGDHETLDEDSPADADAGGEPAEDAWQPANAHAFLFYVGCLPDGVQGRLNQLSQFFRLAHSAATSSSYWANHCEHCGTLLDDHELHCEPDGAFMPSSEVAAANIQLLHIHEPLQAAAGGYAVEPEFFGFMRRS
jgi:ribosomal protein S14